jgi:hypothetical protein
LNFSPIRFLLCNFGLIFVRMARILSIFYLLKLFRSAGSRDTRTLTL